MIQLSSNNWRCDRCDLLLGRLLGRTVQIREGRDVDILVSGIELRVTRRCRKCSALNELKLEGGRESDLAR